MQIIKCYNCENEISDTEIICPYCDFPVSTTKKKIEEEKLALSGGTIKISGKDFEKEKAAILGTISSEETADAPQETIEEKTEPEMTAERAEKEAVFEMQSETLRRSLEERRNEREAARRQKKNKKGAMVLIVALIIVGAFVIIYLVNGLVNEFVGTTKKSKNRKPRKEKVVTSDASKELGFKFHSSTLTIIDQTLIMDGFDGNEDNKPWSEHSSDVVYLTIGNEITTIGSYAFDDLTNLEQVTLADTVAVIGEGAFYGCSYLEEVVLKNDTSSLKSIANNAFTNCESLEKIIFGKKTVRIGDGAFSGCDRLGEITIPDSVTEIGEDAFFGCHNLIIVCNKDSYAYKYATENGIEVKVLDEEESSEEVITEPEKQETKKPEESEKSEKPEKKEPETTTQPSPAPAPTKEEKLSTLQSQLAKAQTTEERDRILQEIDKVAME